MRGMGGMLYSGQCRQTCRGNVLKHSGECRKTFRGMSPNTPENVVKHSGNIVKHSGNVIKHSGEHSSNTLHALNSQIQPILAYISILFQD